MHGCPLGPAPYSNRYVFQAQTITGWKWLVQKDPNANEFGRRDKFNYNYDSDDTSLGLPTSTSTTTWSSISQDTSSQDTEPVATTVARAVDALPSVPPLQLLKLPTNGIRKYCPATSGWPPSRAPISREHPGKQFSQGPVATSTPGSIDQETTSTFTGEGCGCNCRARVEVSTFVVSCSLFLCSIVYSLSDHTRPCFCY